MPPDVMGVFAGLLQRPCLILPQIRTSMLRKSLAALLITVVFGGTALVHGFPLSDSQAERLQKYIPQTLSKLERQSPVHVVLLGDAVGRGMTHDDNAENVLLSLNGHLLQGLEREFYYTGGIRLINPLGGHLQKIKDHQGDEITCEQFTALDATSLNTHQWLTNTAFLNQPDLVLINLGTNDLRFGLSVDLYRETLRQAIAYCQQQGAEVIVIGPTLIRSNPSPAGWGATRVFSDAAKATAQSAKVMFLDPGTALAQSRFAPGRRDPDETSRFVSEAMALELFNYGPEIEETVWMNSRAHEIAGRGIFDQFLNGLGQSNYQVEGTALYAEPNTLKLNLQVSNQSAETKLGALIPLLIGESWEPDVTSFTLEIPPGENQTFELAYRRQIQGQDSHQPSLQSGNSPVLAASFLLSDFDHTELLDLRAPLGPVSVIWDLSPHQSRGDTFPLKFTIRNPEEKAVSGSYELNFAKQRARGTFELGPKEAKDFSAQCGLPKDPSILRTRDIVTLKIESGTHSYVFERELEATRNLSMADPIGLSQLNNYALGQSGPEEGANPSATLKATADEEMLKLTMTVKGARLEHSESLRPIVLEIGVDARPKEEVHTEGFVHPIRIEFAAGSTNGILPEGIPEGAFGNGYNKHIDPQFIQTSLKSLTGASNEHTIEVVIPSAYLYRHEWKLGSPKCQIGLSTTLKLLRANTETGEFGYPEDTTWVLNSPSRFSSDARSMVTLELRNRKPIGWLVTLR